VRSITRIMIVVTLALILGLWGWVAFAYAGPLSDHLQAQPDDLSFKLLSGDTAWLDNNNACADPPEGPRAMWLEIGVTNNHVTETLTGVTLELSGFASSYYTLTADPERYAGNLAPGATFYGYWYVDYNGACQAGRSDTYTLTVRADNLSASARYTDQLTTRSANSIGAGDIISSSQGSGIAIGQIFTQTAEYAFSNSTSVLLQPTGNAGFDDACFRLVGSEVAASELEDVPQGTRDQLLYFFEKQDSGKVTMIYYWQAQCQSESITEPWAGSTIGNNNRYSKKYGALFTTFPEASLSLDVTSEVTPTYLTQAGEVTYTVRFTNVFTQPVELNAITVTLDSGLSFASYAPTSDVDASNSSLSPTTGATDTLRWRGIPGVSYTVPAATGPEAPGVLELVLRINVPPINGTYTQQGKGRVGKLSLGPANASVIMNQPTAVDLAAFDAAPHADGIRVTWETAAELDHLGFNLYRSASPSGPWTRLNADLILPKVPGSVFGGLYEWFDTDVTPGGTTYYRLEDIDIYGVRTFHGPTWATSGAPLRYTLFLPLISQP